MKMVFDIFLEESSMVFSNIQDRINLRYDVMNLARLILKNKNTVPLEEISSSPEKNMRSNSKPSNDSIKGIINWLYDSHIIGGCGLVRNCDINNYLQITKFYFRDVGFAYWLLGRVYTDFGNFIDSITKNYIYIALLNPLKSNASQILAPEIPSYATYAKGETDFFLMNRVTDAKLAIEAEYGGGEPKTSTAALTDKVDFIVKAQGKGPFGISGKVHTIPIYLLGKFNFKHPQLN
jgi:predicted AAA+ superfamily ATPase